MRSPRAMAGRNAPANRARGNAANLRASANSIGEIGGVVGFLQQVLDPTLSNAGQQSLGGSGIGTSAVTGGLLQITSTTATYYDRPLVRQQPLPAGTYTVAFTVANYVSGSIAVVSSTNTNLTVAPTVWGPTASANGSYSATVVRTTPGYIGLGGQGAAVVNSMQITSLTIVGIG